ncbi:NUDIX hydrolase [Laspinema olomoucense]|uniref:NUDIX hydrolase n=1 Tax=Laspinema olomoucense D3b TaxID=2953688 RepID=A0ABT2NBW0_9CYAN|nr:MULTISPECIES: NUDIX hydrolase [unclassified Laspinema]MCT7975142.1 NUDIX hydrolase [Laspinema sp. D3d]MCT7979215.1 NUDIX hydrolase [Laspinema sp. D3b]MCT7990656.1 NUDIX hydrolase [Laspinema sp. D3a]
MKRLWHFTQAVLGIVFRHPVLGISIIPLLDNGQIVLVRRRDNGKWGLPGGMVDWGEDIPNTLKRELTEETGLEVTQVGRLVGIYSAPDRDPRIHSICVVVAAQVQGEMKIYDTSEILEVKAFDRDSLPLGQLSHDHDRQLQDFLNGVTAVA